MTSVEPVWTRAQTRPLGWWGMLLGVTTEATLIATLVASYFYLRFKNTSWPPHGIDRPRVLLPCIATAVLLAAAPAMFAAGRALVRGRLGLVRALVAAAAFAALIYAVAEFLLLRDDWSRFHPSSSAYASIYYTLTGVVLAHVAAGVLLLAWVLFQLARPAYRPVWGSSVQVAALYMYFAAGAAAVTLVTAYLSPQL